MTVVVHIVENNQTMTSSSISSRNTTEIHTTTITLETMVITGGMINHLISRPTLITKWDGMMDINGEMIREMLEIRMKRMGMTITRNRIKTLRSSISSRIISLSKINRNSNSNSNSSRITPLRIMTNGARAILITQKSKIQEEVQ